MVKSSPQMPPKITSKVHSVAELDEDEEEEDGEDEDQIAQVSFSYWIAFLLVIFGISSWVAINGLWMQLPLLFNKLPERWNLPAYLSPIIQIANFAPLIYMLLTRISRSYGRKNGSKFLKIIQPPERLANYSILLLGFVASILLTQYWNVVVIVPGLPPNANMGDNSEMAIHGHSIGLFVLTFFLGIIDCMSSVTFIAYLANMPSAYAGALLFGETCSGLIPSLVALIQGASSEPICKFDAVTNSTQPIYNPPRFSVSAFMGILAGITFLSLTAFSLLDCLPCGLGRSVTLAYQKVHSISQSTAHEGDISTFVASLDDPSSKNGDDVLTVNRGTFIRFFAFCCIVTAYTSCLGNGLLPAIQTFSTASYDTQSFHLAVTLSGLISPISAILVTVLYDYNIFCLHALSIFSHLEHLFCCNKKETEGSFESNTKVASKSITLNISRIYWRLLLLASISALPSAYIIYLAAVSPYPPIIGGFGAVLAILAWITSSALFTIQRTWITLILVRHGTQRNLRVLGVSNQAGAVIGAFVSFILTAYAKYFVSKTPCSP